MATTSTEAHPGAPTPTKAPDAAKIAAISAAALGAAMTLGGLGLFGGRTALSIGAGTVIAVANLVSMNAIIRAMLRPAEAEAEAASAPASDGEIKEEAAAPAPDHVAEGKRGGAAWGAFALVKIVVLFGGIWILLTRGLVDPIPLVVGYGVLPLGITVSGLFTSLTPRPRARHDRPRGSRTE
jgi:hypothetical protein